MSSTRHHNILMDGAAWFWTSSIVEKIPALASRTTARKFLEILDEERKNHGVKLLGYVIMPDHVHLVVWSESAEMVKRFVARCLSRFSVYLREACECAAARGDARVTRWLERFKSRARAGSSVRVWKERGRGFSVTEDDIFLQKLKYMHENPVRKNLAASAEDWEFSSAAWYADKGGPIAIDCIDQ